MRLRPVEILLLEIVIYLGLWLWNDYLATLLSLTFAGIFLFILLISLLAEWIERSKVPRWYYSLMIVSILAPLIAAALFLLFTGSLPWLNKP